MVQPTQPSSSLSGANLGPARHIHELAIEMRGPKSKRREAWANLLRVHALVMTLLEDFSGLEIVPMVGCPSCLTPAQRARRAGLGLAPMQWQLSALRFRAQKCEICGEPFEVHNITVEEAPAPTPLNLSLASAAPSELPPERKFIANKLRLGKPLEAYRGLGSLLGLASEEELRSLCTAGVAAIGEEVLTRALDSALDEWGWSAADWLHYVLEERAGMPSKPRAAGAPPLDEGNEGKTLDDFVTHPLAVAAKLGRAHLTALRLFSTSLHARLNMPWFVGCSREAPHPYPVLVATLLDAWGRLRAAAAEKPTLFSKLGALGVPETDGSRPCLYCVFASGEDVAEYKQRGCLEMGFLTASKYKATAERHAYKISRTDSYLLERPTLLKLRTDHIVDISFFSVTPHEGECLLPPCTYLDLKSEATVNGSVGEREVSFRVVEAVPNLLDSLHMHEPTIATTK